MECHFWDFNTKGHDACLLAGSHSLPLTSLDRSLWRQLLCYTLSSMERSMWQELRVSSGQFPWGTEFSLRLHDWAWIKSSPVKPWHDWSPGGHLGCNLWETLNERTLLSPTHTSDPEQPWNNCCWYFEPLSFGLMCYAVVDDGCGRQNNGPPKMPMSLWLEPVTVKLHSKRVFSLLIIWPWDVEIIPLGPMSSQWSL